MLDAVGEWEELGTLAVPSDISRLQKIDTEEQTEKDHGNARHHQLLEENRMLYQIECFGL